MKKLLSYLFLTLVASAAAAQISFTVVKKDVKCNHAELGKAEVNVTETDPPYVYLWSNGATANSVDELSEGTYSVLITDDSGDDTTVTIVIRYLECEMQPEIIFTPNDDGINDFWTIINSQFFPEARVLVFNRLGQKVFDRKGSYEPWDGKDLLGVKLPDASYYYVIYHDSSDDGTIIKGCISILK